MKRRHFLIVGVILLLCLFGFPWFQQRADRSVAVFNQATLISLALQLQQIAAKNGGQLPSDWGNQMSTDDLQRSRFKTMDGKRIAWLSAAASPNLGDRLPLLIAPEPHVGKDGKRRLVLLSDLTVDERPESELSAWLEK
jgi:hypothetical protein